VGRGVGRGRRVRGGGEVRFEGVPFGVGFWLCRTGRRRWSRGRRRSGSLRRVGEETGGKGGGGGGGGGGRGRIFVVFRSLARLSFVRFFVRFVLISFPLALLILFVFLNRNAMSLSSLTNDQYASTKAGGKERRTLETM
jgi:hypothetical protein